MTKYPEFGFFVCREALKIVQISKSIKPWF